MNLGMMFLLFLVACGSLMGLFFVANQHSSAVIDTYGNTIDNESNNTSMAVQDMTGAGLDVAGAVIVFIGLIIGAIVLLSLALAAGRRIH